MEPLAPPAPAAPRAVARLVLSSGPVVDVDRVVIIGRAPRARRPGDDEARLVTVPSPHQEISSTHVEFRPGSGPDQGSAVVTDLGSTNGTVVVQPGLRAEDLQPGIPVQLNPGATVDLGEGVTIQIAPPD
jgi:pSer/pThr/pTyr-binding forkhead associated (FHA) protein